MNSLTTLDMPKPTRRSFIIGISAVGVGMVLNSTLAGGSLLRTLQEESAQSFEPTVWVKIDPDGTVTITVAKSEMGQGIRTSLAMIVAEEMDADWSKVKVKQARPNAGNGSLGTGGSGSVSGSYNNLRRAGATVRSMMISAAAKKWSIAEANCTTKKSVVTEKNGTRQATYAELIDVAATISVPTNATLKNVANFTLIGTRQPHIDNPDIVSGKAIYGLDVRIPGMKYAVVAMPPAFGASVRTFDASDALKIPGVIKAERVPGISGVVVVADNTFAALQGREALKIEWNMGNNVSIDSSVISSRMKTSVGTVSDVPATSAIKIEAAYELPYLAHATMEPMNCVADVRTDSAEIWCPSQSGDGVLNAAAQATGLAASKITVNTTLMGGGFGRRSNTDFASYAARISLTFKMPILFMFTRADDMKNDGYRPASYHSFKGGLSADGKVTGWIQKVSPSNMGENPTYQVPSPSLTGGSLSSPVPTGAWRSVQHSSTVFVNECFMDELAIAAKADPYQFRRNLLPAGRLRDVLDQAASRAEWTKPLPPGWGRGIACTDSYAYCAHVIEVSVSDIGILKIERVVAVIDCGVAINPMGVEAQVEGACVDALSTALKSAITIEKGAVKQSTFIDFEWLRINEMPKIEVYIIPSTSSPRGVGEAGYPSVSPALCNAIYDATKKRIRSLPVQQSQLIAVDEPATELQGNVNVYPSPFSTTFRIDGKIEQPKGNELTFTIQNLLGSRMMEFTASMTPDGTFSQEIDFSHASSGVFFLSIRNGRSVIVRKVVKE
ncbi:MAG: molybdopterin-dependent oxidoreductase [Ignavibacteria bacterium]|nr:molybdopterin-dependent oxidoreductase [Ignavibacteria bacterium]